MGDEILEIYEKCRVLIKALLCGSMDNNDKDAIAWILDDYVKRLMDLAR